MFLDLYHIFITLPNLSPHEKYRSTQMPVSHVPKSGIACAKENCMEVLLSSSGLMDYRASARKNQGCAKQNIREWNRPQDYCVRENPNNASEISCL